MPPILAGGGGQLAAGGADSARPRPLRQARNRFIVSFHFTQTRCNEMKRSEMKCNEMKFSLLGVGETMK
jgi:hypothetical protein